MPKQNGPAFGGAAGRAGINVWRHSDTTPQPAQQIDPAIRQLVEELPK